jgi:hypothetical protein
MDSEGLFSAWLDQHQISYERHYDVGPGNVDFLIQSTTPHIYCDVKEVQDSRRESGWDIDAYHHVRDDIRKLRKKFRKQPDLPLILVTMNFSARFFTGFTLATALLGDAGVLLDRPSLQVTKAVHYLPRGNAVLTRKHNRSITGVLVFTGLGARHTLYVNPFYEPFGGEAWFPDTDVVRLNPEGEDLLALSDHWFWPISRDET